MSNRKDELREKIDSLINRAGFERETIPRFTRYPDREAETLREWKQTLRNQILQAIKEVGMVMLAEDQDLPNNPHTTAVHLDAGIYDGLYRRKYDEAQQDMLRANFKKIEEE